MAQELGDNAVVHAPARVEAHVFQQPAIEQLEEALESYDGALLLVTHDRRLLENVRLDARWNVDNGVVTELLGHTAPKGNNR